MTIRRKITANDGIKKPKDEKADKHSNAMLKSRVLMGGREEKPWEVIAWEVPGRRSWVCHVTCTEGGDYKGSVSLLKTDISFLC